MIVMPFATGDQLRADIAYLESRAEATGDKRYVYAANALRNEKKRGRPAIDDAAAIDEIEHMVEQGIVKGKSNAARHVALARGGGQSTEAEVRRLTKKHARRK